MFLLKLFLCSPENLLKILKLKVDANKRIIHSSGSYHFFTVGLKKKMNDDA